MKISNKKQAIMLLLLLGFFYCKAQVNNDSQMYVPIMIDVWDEKGGRLSWNGEDGESLKDLYFNIMKPDFINPDYGRQFGKSSDLAGFVQWNKKLLYTRKECDSLITFFLTRLSKIVVDKKKGDMRKYYIVVNETVYYHPDYPPKDTAGRSYTRCVCLPAKEIMTLRHGSVYAPDRIWLEPSDFVKQFSRYQLDYLDIKEIPYLKRFPLDIDPSFDCSKATTFVEKTICRDIDLSKLDKELSEQYQIYLFKYGNSAKEGQRLWSTQREEKTLGQTHERAVQILKELYTKRILELRNSK